MNGLIVKDARIGFWMMRTVIVSNKWTKLNCIATGLYDAKGFAHTCSI